MRDYGLTGEDSRLAIESGLVEAEWFRPPIDPERLRALQVRTNARAARDTLMWLGLLAVFGYLAFRALGTWWAVPAFLVYGALYGGAGDSRWHECGHGHRLPHQAGSTTSSTTSRRSCCCASPRCGAGRTCATDTDTIVGGARPRDHVPPPGLVAHRARGCTCR